MAGSHTHIAMTRAKRRRAARSLSTPFCAQTTVSRSAAVPPPSTGRSAQAVRARGGVLALHGEDQHVVGTQLDVLAAPRRSVGARATVPADVVTSSPSGPQSVQLASARDEDDVLPGPGEEPADDAADRTGPDDDVSHRPTVARRVPVCWARGMTASPEPRPQRPRRADELMGIAFGTMITILAIVYTVVPLVPVLVAWETVAIVYLVLVFTLFRNRTTRDAPTESRALPGKVVELLSWVLPIAASGTGVTAAVILLTTDVSSGSGSTSGAVVGVLGSIGVIVAWLLLQTGFAEIYESVYERLPDPGMISFPGIEGDPTLGDFLDLSFTVGTSFAISGATIASRKVRRVILIHSVTSFFYNAFLIAIAIQVIQGVIAER